MHHSYFKSCSADASMHFGLPGSKFVFRLCPVGDLTASPATCQRGSIVCWQDADIDFQRAWVAEHGTDAASIRKPVSNTDENSAKPSGRLPSLHVCTCIMHTMLQNLNMASHNSSIHALPMQILRQQQPGPWKIAQLSYLKLTVLFS